MEDYAELFAPIDPENFHERFMKLYNKRWPKEKNQIDTLYFTAVHFRSNCLQNIVLKLELVE